MNRLNCLHPQYPAGPRDRVKEVLDSRHYSLLENRTDNSFRMQIWFSTAQPVYTRFVLRLYDHVSERTVQTLEK